ncbi:MAG TPA: hypothetical protein VJ694_00470 [Patescibacteria group bacterium]|nr:hypothetical protein [Patescibacteria group bacterium]
MPKRPYSLLFAVSAAFFAWVHASPGFGDPDAYYHLEMARLTAASGPVLAFPWLPFTTLAEHFADHHFLYHVALAPFVLAFGDFTGLKIATVLFAALAVAAFAFLLKTYGVKRPVLWTLPLLFAPGFVFRLLLTKATALALAAFFLFLAALRRRDRAAVFGIAFGYVWLHGGWPLLFAAAGLDALVRRSTRTFWPTLLGLAAGLVVNPFFPANLSFYWEQIVQIAVVGRSDALVAVGNEWYPVDIGSLVFDNASVFLPLAASAAAFAAAIWTNRSARAGSAPSAERRKDFFFAAGLAAVFLLMTLRQARHKEYFLPLALLVGALIAETAFAAVDLRALLARARARLGGLFAPSVCAFALIAAAFAAYALWLPRLAYADRPAFTRFEKAAAWTRAHVPEGETIFHQRWDDFPQLWYRDPSHRYIAGLDALFLYRKDPAKYWLWRDISEGRRRAGSAELIEKGFGARTVIVRTGPDPLLSLMKKDPSFERVYADKDTEVWRIRDGR